jgi:hypothetical protein
MFGSGNIKGGFVMFTNDLKKGTRILLRTFGWEADLIDNARGTIRDARVFGIEDECGSISAHDIVGYKLPGDKVFKTDLEYTPAQLRCMRQQNE